MVISEVDSPSAANIVPIENIEPSTPKKEIEIETAIEVPKIEPPPIIEKELPKSPNPNVEHDITPEVISPTKEPGEIDIQPETEEAQVVTEEALTLYFYSFSALKKCIHPLEKKGGLSAVNCI